MNFKYSEFKNVNDVTYIRKQEKDEHVKDIYMLSDQDLLLKQKFLDATNLYWKSKSMLKNSKRTEFYPDDCDELIILNAYFVIYETLYNLIKNFDFRNEKKVSSLIRMSNSVIQGISPIASNMEVDLSPYLNGNKLNTIAQNVIESLSNLIDIKLLRKKIDKSIVDLSSNRRR